MKLSGAKIDAFGEGISLRGISVVANMTEVIPTMHSALTMRKLVYNESRQLE